MRGSHKKDSAKSGKVIIEMQIAAAGVNTIFIQFPTIKLSQFSFPMCFYSAVHRERAFIPRNLRDLGHASRRDLVSIWGLRRCPQVGRRLAASRQTCLPVAFQSITSSVGHGISHRSSRQRISTGLNFKGQMSQTTAF